MEFKGFPKIERIGKMKMSITQKIHGTNAQIMITPLGDDGRFAGGGLIKEIDLFYVDCKTYVMQVGSRTRWIVPGDDNYGFAAFVHANADEFIRTLGPGQHFGEWAGPGINSGEGLTEKTFFLFDWWKFPEGRPLPPQTKVVPLLHNGEADLHAIETAMNDLKTNGSKIVPGFMRPEGVVVMLGDIRYKKVFDAEETQWKKADEKYRETKSKENKGPDLSHLCQPIRLAKLLSKDERLVIEYPESLKRIAEEYVRDLEEEGQIGPDPVIKKQFSKFLYPFIKENVK